MPETVRRALVCLLAACALHAAAAPSLAETAKEELITKQDFTDIAEQYMPTTDKLAFIWYFQFARSSDAVQTLKAALEVEINNGDLVMVENQYDNSLIFRFKSDEAAALHRECLDLVRQIDRRPSQALIDVLIAQVDVKKADRMGIEWQNVSANALNQAGLGAVATVDHGFVNDPAAAQVEHGFKLKVEKTDAMKAFVHGLLGSDAIDVISSPHVLAVNNQPALFKIQRVIPIITSTEVLQGGAVNNVTEDKEAGILLAVLPRISTADRIVLDITQTVDDIDFNSVTRQATTTQRALVTSVSLRDGQTVMLGGFIKDKKRVYFERIPILSRLPGVGNLFSSRLVDDEKYELVVFITPRIIDSTLDGDNARRLMTDRLTAKADVERRLAKIAQYDPAADPFETVFVVDYADGWYARNGSAKLGRLIAKCPATITPADAFPPGTLERIPARFAPFGYGPIRVENYPYNTLLEMDEAYAFLHRFTVDDPAAYARLGIMVASDSAALIYVNGRLVDRDPLIATRSGHDFEYWNRDVEVPADVLRPGENTVVALLKNEKNSRECFFDLKLVGRKPGAAAIPVHRRQERNPVKRTVPPATGKGA